MAEIVARILADGCRFLALCNLCVCMCPDLSTCHDMLASPSLFIALCQVRLSLAGQGTNLVKELSHGGQGTNFAHELSHRIRRLVAAVAFRPTVGVRQELPLCALWCVCFVFVSTHRWQTVNFSVVGGMFAFIYAAGVSRSACCQATSPNFSSHLMQLISLTLSLWNQRSPQRCKRRWNGSVRMTQSKFARSAKLSWKRLKQEHDDCGSFMCFVVVCCATSLFSVPLHPQV